MKKILKGYSESLKIKIANLAIRMTFKKFPFEVMFSDKRYYGVNHPVPTPSDNETLAEFSIDNYHFIIYVPKENS